MHQIQEVANFKICFAINALIVGFHICRVLNVNRYISNSKQCSLKRLSSENICMGQSTSEFMLDQTVRC